MWRKGKKLLVLAGLCLALAGCGGRPQEVSGQAVPEQEAVLGQASREREAVPGQASPGQEEASRQGAVPGQASPEQEVVPGQASRGQGAVPGQASPEQEAVSGQASREQEAVPGQASREQGAVSGQASPGQEDGSGVSPGAEDAGAFAFTICFAGDINLDENWCTTQYLDRQENGIYDCISRELVEAMEDADIMCLNNEFTYSTGGGPLAGKAYTFRAKPERVEVLGQLGVDAVTLANNHVFDYGKEALLDTFAVLEEAGIPYFGAGRTLADAMEPLYLEAGGRRVALVAASRAEKNKMTPQATDTEPGILRCYDTELFLQTVREAKENADVCIAFVHWGTEYSYELEQVQLDTAREYLDAGADAVVGAHSHCLQGMEYYDGKPIIYSLGNYWFNEKTLDTMLLQLHFSGDDTGAEVAVQVIPAVQAGYCTTYVSDTAEQRRIYDFLESISVNVAISDEGVVTEVPE